MIRKLLIAAAASATVAGCAMNAGAGADAGMTMGAMTPTTARAYVELAASSDMFEIQSSQMAMQRSQNAQVRQFAQMMVTHHTQTTQQLMAAARAANVMMPTQMMPMHREMLQRLQGLSGMQFDRMYGMQQVMAHEAALQVHGSYAARGDVPALRQVAQTATPIIRGHLEQARQLPR